MPPEPSDWYSPEPNVLERRAASFLERCARARGGEAPDDPAPAMRRTTRKAVLLAAAAGIVSGGLIGGSEVWMRQSLGLDDLDFWESLPYWIGWFAVAGVISAVEIAFLYWVSLRGIGRVVAIAPVEVGPDGYPGLFSRGFARGALEFPNPRIEIFGIDPYAYVPKWRLIARSVAYKMKVGVSSFVLRVFLRRVATRLAIRGIVPLVAGPLYAAWNAYIVWRIMAEARVRAFGPAAVDQMMERCFGPNGVGEAARAVLLEGAAELVRRAGDAHPNYVYLMARLREGCETGDEPMAADWSSARERLAGLGDDERRAVIRFLALAAVLGSKTRRRQRALVDEACAAAGLRPADNLLKDLRRQLGEGRLTEPGALADVVVEKDRAEAA